MGEAGKMKIIDPSFELIDPPGYMAVLDKIEAAGRVCYRSEPKGNPEAFVRRIIRSGHLSVCEHCNLTAKIICDRGISHELVRHRLASYSQESTRYANYSKDKFGNEITVIKPCFYGRGTPSYERWLLSCLESEAAYLDLLKIRYPPKPEEARSVLPNSLATTGSTSTD
jgi:thymidylate synthase (FAD)